MSKKTVAQRKPTPRTVTDTVESRGPFPTLFDFLLDEFELEKRSEELPNWAQLFAAFGCAQHAAEAGDRAEAMRWLVAVADAELILLDGPGPASVALEAMRIGTDTGIRQAGAA